MDSFLRGEELPKSGRASIANNIKIDDGTFLWDSVNESPGLHYKKCILYFLPFVKFTL